MKTNKLVLLFMLLSIAFTMANAQVETAMHSKADREAMNRWVDSVFNSLTDDERIGQLIMPVVYPTMSQSNIKKTLKIIEEAKIGGILFQKGKPEDQAKLTNMFQAKSKVPMMITLDGEWGLSMRLSGTTRFPMNMMLGAVRDMSLIENYGTEVARQCKEMGIHVNFAPSLDVNSNRLNPVIGTRSFGENVDEVIRRGIAYSKGLENGGVLSVAKHFPGHGDTSDDSHHLLPIVNHDAERLHSVELAPFKAYINHGFGGMMTGHLSVPALDSKSKNPSSLSSIIVSELLKGELGFTGLSFTDALEMKGAKSKTISNTALAALMAGNDILLASGTPIDDYNAIKKALKKGDLSKEKLYEHCRKVLQYKYILGLNEYKDSEIEGLSKRLNSSHADYLAAKLNSEAVTLIKNNDDFLPIKELENKKKAVLSIGSTIGNPFQTMLNSYDKFDRFSIVKNSSAAHINSVYSALSKYDMIVCSIHTSYISEAEALRRLAKEKDVVLAFMVTPYTVSKYQSVASAQSVIVGYEPTTLAQKYTAQAIMGGIGTKGKLPVTISESFPFATGIETEKNRLGYHHPEEVGMSASILSKIDSIAQMGVDEGAYPGCQILVAKDGMVVYQHAFGYLDSSKEQKVNNETVYDLASVSKATGTLAAVMKAYDERKFHLNTPLGTLLPELEETNKSSLLVKELLYHQSGVVPVINFYQKAIDPDSYDGSLFSTGKKATHPIAFDSRTYIRNDFELRDNLVAENRSMEFPIEVADKLFMHHSFLDTAMQDIGDSKLIRRGKYSYSCVNFMMLRFMVEEQMKQPMDKLLRESFFDKIGAYTLCYNPRKRMPIDNIAPTENDQFVRKQLLRGYVHDEAAAFQGGVSGNAGLFSSANDLSKLLQMYLNNGVYGSDILVSPETCKMFTSSKSPSSRRGLGFDKPDVKNESHSPCAEGTPASVYGHTGYTGTAFWIDPENKMQFIFLSNRVNPSRTNTKLFSLNIRTEIQKLLYESMKN